MRLVDDVVEKLFLANVECKALVSCLCFEYPVGEIPRSVFIEHRESDLPSLNLEARSHSFIAGSSARFALRG